MSHAVASLNSLQGQKNCIFVFIYFLFLAIPASSIPAQAGKYRVKSRRSEYDDMTPNPRKLLHIGNELRKLNKIISDMAPVSELSGNARNRCRKEKNKLASRYVSWGGGCHHFFFGGGEGSQIYWGL